MSGPSPNWAGIFNWSLRFQDGSRERSDRRELSPDEIAWLQEAMANSMKDFGQRMREIKRDLEEPGAAEESSEATLEQKEQLLDELMEIVENIDFARDLGTIGGLPTLLDLMDGRHQSLRWRATEVAAVCVQNNPPVQQALLEAGALPILIGMVEDPDTVCRTKALLALSGMIRGNATGMARFRSSGGVQKLVAGLAEPDLRFTRKALQLLLAVLRGSPTDAELVCSLGAVPRVVALLDNEDNDVREHALELILELSKSPSAGALLLEGGQLKEALQILDVRLDSMPREDWEQVQEEVEYCKMLRAFVARGPAASEDSAREMRQQFHHQ